MQTSSVYVLDIIINVEYTKVETKEKKDIFYKLSQKISWGKVQYSHPPNNCEMHKIFYDIKYFILLSKDKHENKYELGFNFRVFPSLHVIKVTLCYS